MCNMRNHSPANGSIKWPDHYSWHIINNGQDQISCPRALSEVRQMHYDKLLLALRVCMLVCLCVCVSVSEGKRKEKDRKKLLGSWFYLQANTFARGKCLAVWQREKTRQHTQKHKHTRTRMTSANVWQLAVCVCVCCHGQKANVWQICCIME